MIESIVLDGFRHAMRNGRNIDESILFFREYCHPFIDKMKEEGDVKTGEFGHLCEIVERMIYEEYAKTDSPLKAGRLLREIRPVLYALIAAVLLVGILYSVSNYKNNNINDMSGIYEHKDEVDEGSTG